MHVNMHFVRFDLLKPEVILLRTVRLPTCRNFDETFCHFDVIWRVYRAMFRHVDAA